MSIYEGLGVRTIINAEGPSTRLSGGFLNDEVAGAMVEVSRRCVDIAELQAARSLALTGPPPLAGTGCLLIRTQEGGSHALARIALGQDGG